MSFRWGRELTFGGVCVWGEGGGRGGGEKRSLLVVEGGDFSRWGEST